MVYFATRKNNDIVEYLDTKTRSWRSYSKVNIKHGYKTRSGADKKVKALQVILKEYFSKSDLASIRNRDLNDCLYVSSFNDIDPPW